MILGSENVSLNVYINHDLPVTPITEQVLGSNQKQAIPLSLQWMDEIIEKGGNNWRKIFNIYAKLCHQLERQQTETGVPASNEQTLGTWQSYRDSQLLRTQGSYQLTCFSGHCIADLSERFLNNLYDKDTLSLVTGKKCAEALGLTDNLHWLNEDFAQVIGKNILVTPYFDYRQLSNAKLEILVHLIKERQ